jgi:hypothetical protein
MKAGRASGLDVFGGGSVEPSEDLLNMANWNFEAETNQRRSMRKPRARKPRLYVQRAALLQGPS